MDVRLAPVLAGEGAERLGVCQTITMQNARGVSGRGRPAMTETRPGWLFTRGMAVSRKKPANAASWPRRTVTWNTRTIMAASPSRGPRATPAAEAAAPAVRAEHSTGARALPPPPPPATAPGVKSVLITGCSSGIGRDAAGALRARGWRVFAACRKEPDCARLRAAGFDSPRLDYQDEATIRTA